MKKLVPTTAGEKRAYNRGVKMAASLAGQYDGASTHDYRLEDCILAKLNVPGARKPRRNTQRVRDPEAAWLAGVALGLAEMHRRLLHGNDSTGVCMVARFTGLTLQRAKAAGVSPYDLEQLRKAGVR